MALKFLSKKRWHVRKLDNIRKVAEAEMKSREEQTRLAEMRREREEEKDLEALRQLQIASGRIPKEKPRLEWLYKAPPIKKREDEETISREDILANLRSDEVMQAEQEKELKSQQLPGVKFLTEIAPKKGDEEIIIREDPLTAILARKQKEQDEEAERLALLKKAEEAAQNKKIEEERLEREYERRSRSRSRDYSHRHNSHHHGHRRDYRD